MEFRAAGQSSCLRCSIHTHGGTQADASTARTARCCEKRQWTVKERQWHGSEKCKWERQWNVSGKGSGKAVAVKGHGGSRGLYAGRGEAAAPAGDGHLACVRRHTAVRVPLYPLSEWRIGDLEICGEHKTPGGSAHRCVNTPRVFCGTFLHLGGWRNVSKQSC